MLKLQFNALGSSHGHGVRYDGDVLREGYVGSGSKGLVGHFDVVVGGLLCIPQQCALFRAY